MLQPSSASGSSYDEAKRKKGNVRVRNSREKGKAKANIWYRELETHNEAYRKELAKNEAKCELLSSVFGKTSECGSDLTAEEPELIDIIALKSTLKNRNNPTSGDMEKIEHEVEKAEKRVERQKTSSTTIEKEMKVAVVSHVQHLQDNVMSIIDGQLTQLGSQDKHYDAKVELLVHIKGLLGQMFKQDQQELQSQQQLQISQHFNSIGCDLTHVDLQHYFAPEEGSSSRQPSQCGLETPTNVVPVNQNKAFEMGLTSLGSQAIEKDDTSLGSQAYQQPNFQSTGELTGETLPKTINGVQIQDMPSWGQEAPAGSLLFKSDDGTCAWVSWDQNIPLVVQENQPDHMVQTDEGVGVQLHIPVTPSERMEPAHFEETLATPTRKCCLLCEEGLPFCLSIL